MWTVLGWFCLGLNLWTMATTDSTLMFSLAALAGALCAWSLYARAFADHRRDSAGGEP